MSKRVLPSEDHLPRWERRRFRGLVPERLAVLRKVAFHHIVDDLERAQSEALEAWGRQRIMPVPDFEPIEEKEVRGWRMLTFLLP